MAAADTAEWASGVKAAFRKADTTQTGLISRKDLLGILRQLDGGQTLVEGELEELLDCVELRDDGRLAYEAFVDWLLDPELSFGGPGGAAVVKVTLTTWQADDQELSLEVPWGTTVEELQQRLAAKRRLQGSVMEGFAELPGPYPIRSPCVQAFDLAVSGPMTDSDGRYFFPEGARPGAPVHFRNTRQTGDDPLFFLHVLDYLEGIVVSMSRATGTMVFFWRRHVGKGYNQFNVIYSASWAVRGPAVAAPFVVATGLQLRRCQEPPFTFPVEVRELLDSVAPADEAEGRREQLSSLLSDVGARRMELRVLLQDQLAPAPGAWDARAAERALASRLCCRAEGVMELLLAAATRDLGSLQSLLSEGGSTQPLAGGGRLQALALRPGAGGCGAVLRVRRAERGAREEVQVTRGTFRHLGGGELLCRFSALAERDAQRWHEWQVKPVPDADKELRVDLKEFVADPYSRFLAAVQAGKDWMYVPQSLQGTGRLLQGPGCLSAGSKQPFART